jgi:hypothetical protein
MGRAKYGSLSLRLDDSVKQATAKTTANANAGVLRFAQNDKLKQATTTAATTATTANDNSSNNCNCNCNCKENCRSFRNVA